MRTILIACLVLILFVVLNPMATRADSVTYDFAGILANSFNGSNTVIGQFTINLASDTISSFHFTTPLGTIDSTNYSASVIDLGNAALNGGVDYLDVAFFANAGDHLTLFYTANGFNLQTGNVAVSQGLTQNALICFGTGSACGNTTFISFFNSATSSPVPEPSSLLLLGTGLLGLMAITWRRVGAPVSRGGGRMNLRPKSLFSFGLLGLLALMLPNTAQADAFTFTVNGGSGTLSATNNGGGMWIADSGAATYNLTAFTLYPGTDNGAIQTSPSGMILFDNVLYPNSNPTLDIYGLLFIDASGNELNIFGGPNVVQTFKLTAVPEPETISLFLSGMLGFGLLIGMKSRRQNPRVGEA